MLLFAAGADVVPVQVVQSVPPTDDFFSFFMKMVQTQGISTAMWLLAGWFFYRMSKKYLPQIIEGHLNLVSQANVRLAQNAELAERLVRVARLQRRDLRKVDERNKEIARNTGRCAENTEASLQELKELKTVIKNGNGHT